MTVIDLTHTIREDMPVYPGTEPPRLTTACTVSQCGYRETLLHMYSHTGTHMDAPAHMMDGAPTLDSFGPDRFVGRGYVLDCRGQSRIPRTCCCGTRLPCGTRTFCCSAPGGTNTGAPMPIMRGFRV